MPSRRPDQRLRDIVEHIDLIVQFTAGMTFDQYVADARTRFAVERCLSIISEAARKLGIEAEASCPEIRWMDIRGLGNHLRREYLSIRQRVIWKIVTDNLQELRAACQRQLTR
jgi:uncharacterized protein with HEPN domain